jgi:SAM-dependent methyltransferase
MQGRLLELGCGAGADLAHFAGLGWDVMGLDFSRAGLHGAAGRLDGAAGLVQGHLSLGLPFAESAFSAVFAHLSLHYFDDETTRFLFAEIHRVIGLNGVLALRVKSVENESCGRGELIGRDTYLYRGHLRHFFSKAFLDKLIAQLPWGSPDGWQNDEEPGYLSALLQKNRTRTIA